VQNLGAESAIVGDKMDGLLEIDVIRVGAELVKHGKEDCGERWKLVEILDPAMEVG
jgi:hypothetical protein